MAIKQLNRLTKSQNFFAVPQSPKQRMYEALRAFFLEDRPSADVARAFGYSPGSFRVLCHQFRHGQDFQFFATVKPGPRFQKKKTAAREAVIKLRKQNRSIYEISISLKEEGLNLSPTAVGEVLRAEGFAPLPRRLDEERSIYPRPSAEVTADARAFSLEPRKFTTQCGGLFLFLPDLVRLNPEVLAQKAGLPGSKMIPASRALLASLALKLWSVERKGHIMSLAADPGIALFSALNAIPKKSFFSEYSSRITPKETQKLLTAWHQNVLPDNLFDANSFNLDFHSIPYFGADPLVENHYVAMRSRSQPSVLVFLAQDAAGRAFCYSNADIRKGEQADEILRFVKFWKANHGEYPRHLVFDSKLTTYQNLLRIDDLKIPFITLRRRSPALKKEIDALPPSAWRMIDLDVPTRKYRTPRVFEQIIQLHGRKFRQIFILDLGHDDATILLTNQHTTSLPSLITRYAQRMLIENALSDAVRFFHMNALSSSVGLKVDYDMALLVIASGLYRLIGRRMRGYGDAQARTIFRDLIDLPATVIISKDEVRVDFHRRSHLPIILASDLADRPIKIPWWEGRTLRLTTHRGSQKC